MFFSHEFSVYKKTHTRVCDFKITLIMPAFALTDVLLPSSCSVFVFRIDPQPSPYFTLCGLLPSLFLLILVPETGFVASSTGGLRPSVASVRPPVKRQVVVVSSHRFAPSIFFGWLALRYPPGSNP